MGSIVFVGAHSDIAQAALPYFDENQSISLLTRDPEALPPSIQASHACYTCDPHDPASILGCFKSVAEQGPISGMVHFCGNITLKPFAMLTPKVFEETVRINLLTAFNAAHAAMECIERDASLVFFSSAAAHIGLAHHEAIAAAKSGVEGLSRSLAASYAHLNIRSNVIAPGLVESKLAEPILRTEQGRKQSFSMHALKRLGQPQSIAKAIHWLLDPDNDWVTGEVIRIDGGLSTLKVKP